MQDANGSITLIQNVGDIDPTWTYNGQTLYNVADDNATAEEANIAANKMFPLAVDYSEPWKLPATYVTPKFNFSLPALDEFDGNGGFAGSPGAGAFDGIAKNLGLPGGPDFYSFAIGAVATKYWWGAYPGIFLLI